MLTLLVVGALVETAWTVYLAWRLPRHYTANHWDLAWVGLDSAQVLMLLLSAWAAWRRRAILILFSCASGSLLLVDAWFDVTTTRYDEIAQSILSLVIEVPSAFVLFWIAGRMVKRLGATWITGSDPESIRIRRIPFPAREPDSNAESTQS